ncbi:alpha/beta hydrolase [Pseudomonadota bacterium]
MKSPRRIILLSISLMLAIFSPVTPAREVIPIWGEEQPPFYKPHTLEEYEEPCWRVTCAYQVVNPTLTLYLPAGDLNGVAVVILPGGGYEAEAVYHEGYEIAETLAQTGTIAAVLKYRLPNPQTATKPELVPIADVRRALKILREKQQEPGFEATKFGVMGFSAGSHLATAVSLSHSPDANENPDFSMLIYGVTRLTAENRKWLEDTLYHRAMTPAEIEEQTFLERVDSTTPPAFLVHSYDDETCHFTESTLYAEALKENGVEVEMHLFARGGHGFGPGRDEDGTSQWLSLADNWLGRLGQAP